MIYCTDFLPDKVSSLKTLSLPGNKQQPHRHEKSQDSQDPHPQTEI